MKVFDGFVFIRAFVAIYTFQSILKNCIFFSIGITYHVSVNPNYPGFSPGSTNISLLRSLLIVLSEYILSKNILKINTTKVLIN